jgi:hypothetical protein
MENKRYRTKPSELDDVVNPNRDSVYQTDAFSLLAVRVQSAPLRCTHDETSAAHLKFPRHKRRIRSGNFKIESGVKVGAEV